MRGAEGFGMTASFWNAIQSTGRDATAWLPKQASEQAPTVDWLFVPIASVKSPAWSYCEPTPPPTL